MNTNTETTSQDERLKELLAKVEEFRPLFGDSWATEMIAQLKSEESK